MTDITDKKPWILWINYGYEGWQPRTYDTAEEAIEDIPYYSNGSPVQLTKRVDLIPKEAA